MKKTIRNGSDSVVVMTGKNWAKRKWKSLLVCELIPGIYGESTQCSVIELTDAKIDQLVEALQRARAESWT